MTQPPHGPSPDEQPWKPPHEQPHPGWQPGPYGGGRQPPPYPGPYGGQPPPYGGYGGLPGYPGEPGGYVDPAAGLASRWARLAAAIVDLVLLTIIIGLVTFPFINYRRIIETGNTGAVPAGQWAANFVSVVIAFLYYWLLTYKWGQTLGKKLLGIQVVRAADGGAVTQGQAVGRSAFFTVLGGLCGCIGFIDVLWLLWDPRRQALHDKVAQTVVRKVPPGGPDPYAGR
ncbi:Uncharacterized membrane protein YckC, RDD family [Thermomonospora echinospora]|uniref:Uncharacterized membrane protein YckC, RDD family n=1 Tax=Thermomonospora echinospora TaxID=1992 RepID=A0A1H6ABU1_9ACTN|nr:RDD family protein [Thermomonospora echinospora]SEG45921.1 Uncharacterized membrane protein YckC, RDD family [Thermomonospora echinospora]